MENLPLSRTYPIYKKDKGSNKDTCTFNLWGNTALEVMKYLYNDSTIYLDRKYEKCKEICRLYEKSYRGLEGKNGEGCDANIVLNSEIAKGSESV